MAEALLVRPDRKFAREIIATGGGDLKKCMQCATCSVVCDLSNGRGAFPRKEMVWAQWGLKDRLVGDPDVWLCHQCNDCSKHCPRGARPGDVLAAVRQQTVREFATPRFLATWMNRAAFLPVAFLAPIVLLALALVAREPLNGVFGFAHHAGFYADFFPHWLLIGFYMLFTGLAFLAAVAGMVRYWRAMKQADRAAGKYNAETGIVPSVLSTLKSVFTHDRFSRCVEQRSRRTAHMLLFYGFLALFVVTIFAVLDIYVFPRLSDYVSRYPFGLLHPMKILANVGGVALIYGVAKVMIDRRSTKHEQISGSAFDWIFAWLLLGVGITGFVIQFLRFTAGPDPAAPMETIAYSMYFVHLALVFHLLVYLPYSKFAHVLYRAVAMVYAEHTGRHPPPRRQLAVPAATGNGRDQPLGRESRNAQGMTTATR